MYFFVLLVCLQGEPQCVPMVEDPPVFYETIEECEKSLQENGQMISDMLTKDNMSGVLTGQCMKDETVSPS